MSDCQPCVSIGLPVYNGENFLPDTLDSILAQTFQNFELIIADNASTDRTEEICRAYAAQDERLHYYRNEHNLGAARNYNRVFELSTGKYFKWAAHDDLYAPNYLEQCVKILESNPAIVLCYSPVTFIDNQGKHLRHSATELLNLRSPQAPKRFREYLELFFPVPASSPTNSPHKRHSKQQLAELQSEIDNLERHPSGDRWTAIFGLIRSNILQNTPLIAGFVNSDAILLGELAINGEFYEIQEHLFFYRDHEQASGRGYNGYYDYNLWFDPANKGKIVMPLWTWFFVYLQAINRAALTGQETIVCYAHLSRWFWFIGPRLAKELIINCLRVLNLEEVSVGSYNWKLPSFW